jgi:hypothetical protein
MNIDTQLEEWATETQRKYLRAINKHGGLRPAARKLGVSYGAVTKAMECLRKKAAIHGYAPAHDMTKPVPAPFRLKGTSTLYDADGKPKLQWVKTQLDGDQAEQAIRDFVTWLAEDAHGKAPTIAPPAHANAELLAVYPMGDPHFGMYAWADEAGADFDLATAERLTTAAIDRLVASAPPAETALIVELGDFFHTDSSNNRTERSGNALDVDTRWAKVLQVGLRAMVYCITATLRKHQRVIVRIVPGNHDRHSSFALALALDAFFANEARVTIDLSPAAFWFHRHGSVLIGATHGDTCKPNDLPAVMAADRPQDWGATRYRYWYRGHIHHQHVQEYPGVVVEAFRTLAARDAWHAGEGYRAGRDMCCIVHHSKYGEIERHRCDIAMLAAA